MRSICIYKEKKYTCVHAHTHKWFLLILKQRYKRKERSLSENLHLSRKGSPVSMQATIKNCWGLNIFYRKSISDHGQLACISDKVTKFSPTYFPAYFSPPPQIINSEDFSPLYNFSVRHVKVVSSFKSRWSIEIFLQEEINLVLIRRGINFSLIS